MKYNIAFMKYIPYVAIVLSDFLQWQIWKTMLRMKCRVPLPTDLPNQVVECINSPTQCCEFSLSQFRASLNVKQSRLCHCQFFYDRAAMQEIPTQVTQDTLGLRSRLEVLAHTLNATRTITEKCIRPLKTAYFFQKLWPSLPC